MSTLMQTPTMTGRNGDSEASRDANRRTWRGVKFAKGFVRDPLSHWPFVAISRKVFGNAAGFRQNFYGSLSTKYHKCLGRRSSGLTIDADVRQMAKGLRENGLALANAWVDAQTLTSVRNQILPLAESIGEKGAYITTLEGSVIEENVPDAFAFLTEKVKALVEEYFGSCFLIGGVSFRLTRHVPDDVLSKVEAYSNRWHFDSCPTSQLAVFVVLKDVSKAEGPTAALDLAGTREIMRRGYESRNLDDAMRRDIESHPSKVEFIGPAGTMLFANTSTCLHRAGIPEPGRHREWLEFRLYPSRGATDISHTKTPRILKWTHGVDSDS